MRRMTVLAALLALLAVPASASARTCTGGTIYINKGFDQVRLGQSRTTIVGELGKPNYENRNGFMQFGPDDFSSLCDVYRTSGSKHSTARLLSFSGRRFVVSGGIKIFDNGGLRKLKAKYPSMKIVHPPNDSPAYQITGHYQGRKVFTTITPSKLSLSGRALQVFIGYV
ncbi:MAG: hypothetical protein JWN32_3334 [Solirubrobacterales bacterium]|nr:hypothetical protein [Solirubrobacterales bacterium]